MIKKYTYNKLTWIDLVFPTLEEVQEIAGEFGINHIVAQELLTPSLKPKVDLYRNLIYLILHIPAFKHSHTDSVQEVDFIIGDNFLITARYDSIDSVEKFAKMLEVESILGKHNMGSHAGFLFYHLVREIYKSVGDELRFIENEIAEIEHRIFDGKEREMVEEITFVGRNLLDFKKSTSLHREILKSFEIAGRSFFGLSFAYHLRAISEEYFKIDAALKNNIELLAQLRETNNTLVSTKQNDIMKSLSLLAFLALPFTIVTGFFQMNTIHTPIIGSNYDWVTIIILEVAVIGSLFFFAKKKRWF